MGGRRLIDYRPLDAAITVIEAIADVEGEDPLDLGYALEEYIPVVAIKTLATDGLGDWTLRFSVPNQPVTIGSDGPATMDRTGFQWTTGR